MDKVLVNGAPLRLFEAFAGIGTQAMALKEAGIAYETVGISDINEYSVESYHVIHGNHVKNYGDITKIEQFPKHDLFTYSFPCFTGDTLVVTSNGPKRIDCMLEGDLVLTHNHRYRRVTKVMNQGRKEIFSLMSPTFGAVHTTKDHRFVVKHKKTHEVMWKPIGEVTKDEYMLALDFTIDGEHGAHDLENIYLWEDMYYTREKGIAHMEEVFDISVDEDNSFVLYNGLVVHNCQDISNAGKKRGLTEGSGTRSSLLWECERAIEQVRPTYLLLENVEPLGSSPKFRAGLNKWLETLESYGYENYPMFMNGRNYGIPQNRSRFLVFSTLNKDIMFETPTPKELTRQVVDFLDKEVESRYYASVETAMRFVVDETGSELVEFVEDKNRIHMLGYLNTKSQGNKVYDAFGVTPCITTGQPSYFMINGKLRLLTPKECWRLMGIPDEYTEKVYSHFLNKYGPGKTDECMYFQAGNAIIVDVLREIFTSAFINPYK